MILVFNGIALVLLICGFIWMFRSKHAYGCSDTGSFVIVVLGVFLFLISIGFTLSFVGDVLEYNKIDSRIAIIEEENERIEGAVRTAVENYMDFEASTFSNLKQEELIVAVSCYPELKSNELVQRQIDLYVKNRDKLIELENKKIDYEISKWWLYFG